MGEGTASPHDSIEILTEIKRRALMAHQEGDYMKSCSMCLMALLGAKIADFQRDLNLANEMNRLVTPGT